MVELDYIIVKFIFNLFCDGFGVVFLFFYIEFKKYEFILRKFFFEDKGLIINIDFIGNFFVIVVKVISFFKFFIDFIICDNVLRYFNNFFICIFDIGVF